MVKFILFLILFIPFLAFGSDEPMTGDELRKLVSPAENEHVQHSKEVKSNKLHELLTKEEPKESKPEYETNELPKPVDKDNYNFFDDSEKKNEAILPAPEPEYKADELPKPIQTNNNDVKKRNKNSLEKAFSDNKKAKTTHYNDDRYTPPSWEFNSGKKASPMHSGRSKNAKKGPVFGIRLGTEFRAKLIRTTTNIEPTLAELVVVDDVYGDYKMLQKNTQLFAKKRLSTSSNRLYINCVKGITPDGKEFEFSATVTDITTNKLAGLSGAITTDNNIMKRSVSNGVFSAGSEIIKTASGTTVLGQAASTVASTALSEKEAEKDANLGDAEFVIFVTPQDVFVRVDSTF